MHYRHVVISQDAEAEIKVWMIGGALEPNLININIIEHERAPIDEIPHLFSTIGII